MAEPLVATFPTNLRDRKKFFLEKKIQIKSNQNKMKWNGKNLDDSTIAAETNSFGWPTRFRTFKPIPDKLWNNVLLILTTHV